MSRRIAAVLAATALAGAALATTATAAPPSGLETYGAGSTATALQVTLLGQDLAFARTGAVINDAPQAAADGAALLVAGTPVPEGAPSAAPEGEASNEVCGAELDTGADIDPQLELLSLALACVATSASIDDGPVAASEGEALSLTISGAPLAGALSDVTEPLFGGIRELIGQLAPIDEQLAENLGISLEDLVDTLLGSLEEGDRVLAITAGETASRATGSDALGAVGAATADAASIELFPDLPGGALLTITSGASSSSVWRDPVTAEATTEVVPAIVTIEANNELLGILGDVTEPLTDGISQLSAASLPCDESNPLADVVCLELAGERELSQAELEALGLDFGEGTVGVASNAVRVQVLPILAEELGGPGIGIALAETAAAANAAPVQDLPAAPEEPPAPPAEPDAPRDLPRTGADGLPLGVLAGMLGLAVIGGALVRRTALS